MGNEIKVMTFNMRLATDDDGIHRFANRRSYIQEMLEREQPDIIGFQEILDEMQDWLEDTFAGYTVLGHGRSAQYNGEGIPIAYKKSRFHLHAFRQEWLTLDPNRSGACIDGLDQSGCPRMLCMAELIDRESGELMAFFNTHLDHPRVQIAECTQICLRIAECSLPFVLLGDLNAYDDWQSIQMLRGTHSLFGTVEATEHIGGTFHKFSSERIAEGALTKIDYIFTNMDVDPMRTYVVTDGNESGKFYSDHNAVCAFVSIPSREKKE